ncbi:unnamed protein product [Coregonus sp. 'balchen']|nr:unnamed protein product [Coregonus sp. 'balchen']
MDTFVSQTRKRYIDGRTDEQREPVWKKCKGEECNQGIVKEDAYLTEFSQPLPWQKIEAEGLDCDYALLFRKKEADSLYTQLEEEVVYLTGDKTKIQVFGKVYNVPRKQATYGDAGLTYTYSGMSLQASPWTPTLEYIRDAVTKATGQTFNFHRDDERELDPLCPIASVSLGAARDFVFRHREARGKQCRRQINPVKLELAHGSLLLMNSPTNTLWYHSLPARKRVLTPRINLTFRRILQDGKK